MGPRGIATIGVHHGSPSAAGRPSSDGRQPRRFWRARWAELDASANPFAVVTQAHLKAQETAGSDAARYRAKLTLIRSLYRRGYQRADILERLRFIDWVLTLPEGLEHQLWTEVQQFDEEKRMRYVSSWMLGGSRGGRMRIVDLVGRNQAPCAKDRTGAESHGARRAARCQGPGTAVARAASTKGCALPPEFGIAEVSALRQHLRQFGPHPERKPRPGQRGGIDLFRIPPDPGSGQTQTEQGQQRQHRDHRAEAGEGAGGRTDQVRHRQDQPQARQVVAMLEGQFQRDQCRFQ